MENWKTTDTCSSANNAISMKKCIRMQKHFDVYQSCIVNAMDSCFFFEKVMSFFFGVQTTRQTKCIEKELKNIKNWLTKRNKQSLTHIPFFFFGLMYEEKNFR